MQYQWTHVADGGRHQWVLKRNCAMSPRQLAGCLAIVGAVSLGIASAFAMHGAWPVIPFACLEIAALSVAFFVYGRHAADYEKIVVQAGAEWSSSRQTARSLRRVELRTDVVAGGVPGSAEGADPTGRGWQGVGRWGASFLTTGAMPWPGN